MHNLETYHLRVHLRCLYLHTVDYIDQWGWSNNEIGVKMHAKALGNRTVMDDFTILSLFQIQPSFIKPASCLVDTCVV